MPSFSAHAANCGMKDLTIGWGAERQNPSEIIKWMCEQWSTRTYVAGKFPPKKFSRIGAAQVVFSQACPRSTKIGYGENLALYIEAQKLGHVARSEPRLNPVHGPSIITAYIWTPSEKNLKKWYEKLTKPKVTVTRKPRQKKEVEVEA